MQFEPEEAHQIPLDPAHEDDRGMDKREQAAVDAEFAPERKQRLPFLPSAIGLICGRDSAADASS